MSTLLRDTEDSRDSRWMFLKGAIHWGGEGSEAENRGHCQAIWRRSCFWEVTPEPVLLCLCDFKFA